EFKNQPPTEEQRNKLKDIKSNLNEHEVKLADVESVYMTILKSVPNIPTDDVPVGASEDENQIVKTWGEKPHISFEPRNHQQIGEARGWIDKERATKVAGSRFVYLKGELVMLQFALWQFALNVLTSQDTLKQIITANNLNVSSKPFVPVLPPAMARTDVYEATARLNKEEQTYKLADDDLWLNASAEHTLAPMYLDEILEEDKLPIRYIGSTTAFRREAGTYGKDMEGILRLHQFDKLEMESFNLPEDSLQEHYLMVAIQEYLMQQLQLPYQLILKCTADIGGPNARGVDINAWMPGQNKYRETHTADYMTDYQARRMKTRVRRSNDSIQFLHTNDATAFSQRPLIAIIENNQTADMQIKVPEVLKPFLGNREQI
ncbi:MAG: serine--tRNA ligase, partial [Candidatus Saccharimonadales bacterium]